MASNVSDINALLAGRSSDAFTGKTSAGTGSTDSDFSVSAFQGQLDRAVQKGTGMEGISEASVVAESTDDVSAALEKIEEQSSAVKNAGSVLAEEANATAGSSVLSTSKKLDLATVEQNTVMSTLDKSRFAVRMAKQKVSDIEGTLENEKGIEFLNELKSLLLSVSNCDLDDLSLDGDGLEALGNLLVQAGFDPASVEELISDLTLTLEETDGMASVSDFMDDLFELPLAEEEDITQAQVLMPTSDLPFIKSLLTMMGVGEEEIASIMDEASQGNQGVDFGEFIEQLEQLLDTAQESDIAYQTDSEDDAYTSLLEQLDLDSFVEDDDGALTLAALINAFSQKLDQIEQSLPEQAEQSLPDLFTTTTSDALATESGRQGLLNQLFSGLTIQGDSEDAIDESIALSASSDAMVEEIEDRLQVRFMDQISKNGVRTKAAADLSTADNKIFTDLQTGKTDSDETSNQVASGFSDTAGTTRESASDAAIKAAQADAAVQEKTASATSSQSGETTSKSSETQAFVLGVEKSTATTTGTGSTQRAQQSFSSLPDFVTRQVGKSIVRSINNGDDTIRMQLRPPELGRVYMSIDHNGSTMKVSVITEHQSAKDILAANVNEIKAMLSSSGISLESFEVDMSSDFQQSMADARAQDQSARKRQAKIEDGEDAQKVVSDNLTIQTGVINGSGSLHYVA